MTPQEKLFDWVQKTGEPCYKAARSLEIAGPTFSRILHGKRIPTLRQAVRIEKAAGVRVEEWVQSPLTP